MTITFGDLYAGAGLFSHGMKSAGLAPAFAIELSSEAAASYRRNVADCMTTGSVTDTFGVGHVDVLIAGPPCQGFSTLGRRDPLDVRNDLCLAIIPWVDQADPKVVVIENVPPFIKSHHWRQMTDALAERGYEIDVWELDAANYGAPQLRRRAFTIASRVGKIAKPKTHTRTNTADIAFSAPIQHGDEMHIWPMPSEFAMKRITLIPEGGDKRDIMARAPDLCPPSWKKMGCQATDVWGRIELGKPSNTLRCTFQNPSKGRYLHPTENRVISLREGARLQGVPDDWVFVGTPTSIARQIGNGVPIALSKAVGLAVYDALSPKEAFSFAGVAVAA